MIATMMMCRKPGARIRGSVRAPGVCGDKRPRPVDGPTVMAIFATLQTWWHFRDI